MPSEPRLRLDWPGFGFNVALPSRLPPPSSRFVFDLVLPADATNSTTASFTITTADLPVSLENVVSGRGVYTVDFLVVDPE